MDSSLCQAGKGIQNAFFVEKQVIRGYNSRKVIKGERAHDKSGEIKLSTRNW